jgi:hypothetical protein
VRSYRNQFTPSTTEVSNKWKFIVDKKQKCPTIITSFMEGIKPWPSSCKDDWGTMNCKIALFNGKWCRLRMCTLASQYDNQLMEKTHDIYKTGNKKCFLLVYVRRELLNQPKKNMMYIEV